MASKSKTSKSAKNTSNDYHAQQLRRNRIIFGIISIILILSMALALMKF